MRLPVMLGIFTLFAAACRSLAPSSATPPRASLHVWERSPVGWHYESHLTLQPTDQGYRWRFTCSPRLVFRNDCPCRDAAGVWPDTTAQRWIHHWKTLSDTFPLWSEAIPMTRIVIVEGSRRWVIRRPGNLLLPLLHAICPPSP